MKKDQIQAILAQVKFRNWEFVLGDNNGALYLQIQFDAPCNFAATRGLVQEPERQHCRKWQLSPHMTRSEIVGTAWLAVEQAVKHEAAEQFTYRGEAIFDFHFSVDWLAITRARGEAMFDVRPARPWEARLKQPAERCDHCNQDHPSVFITTMSGGVRKTLRVLCENCLSLPQYRDLCART